MTNETFEIPADEEKDEAAEGEDVAAEDEAKTEEDEEEEEAEEDGSEDDAADEDADEDADDADKEEEKESSSSKSSKDPVGDAKAIVEASRLRKLERELAADNVNEYVHLRVLFDPSGKLNIG